MPVPVVEPEDFILTISLPQPHETASDAEDAADDSQQDVCFTLADLKSKFKQHEIASTLQCTGNRMGEMIGKEDPASCGAGQVGTALWRGPLLRDVLAKAMESTRCSADKGHNTPPLSSLGFLNMTGMDGYQVSVPMAKVLDESGDVMIALEMNEEVLSADHGYPARVICPGFVGARSVKWISNIAVMPEEAKSPWQERYYRVFPPNVKDLADINYGKPSTPIYDMPVQSAIVSTSRIPSTRAGGQETIQVKGYALSGAGRSIINVLVSTDPGTGKYSWHRATLSEQAPSSWRRNWAWVLWEVHLPVPEGHGNQALTVTCKATDDAHNTQPETVDSIWNVKGYLMNAWSQAVVSMATGT